MSPSEPTPAPTADELQLLQVHSMYANARLAHATLMTAAQDVLAAVIRHPKFKYKTRLVWADELETLREVVEATRILPNERLPTPEQAATAARWLRGLMRLSEPEQKEIREKLMELGAGRANT